MADNCLDLESCWAFRPSSSSSSPSSSPFSDSLWSISESFNRDNDALTRALQISLSDTSSPLPDTYVPVITSKPEPAPRGTTLIPCSASGRISKRKARVSRKSPTTYITADPANFRQMVQQVTGVRFGEAGQMPVESLVRPEPQRRGEVDRVGLGLMMPTLDTSAVLLDRARMVGSVGRASGSGFEFDGFSSFPTLESWGAM